MRAHHCLRAVALLLAIALVAGALGPGAAAQDVNDPAFEIQWGLQHIGAPQAWAAARGEGITIAIVDSGIDVAHEDLEDKLVAQTSCFGTAGDPGRCSGPARDDNGHGTHVAGIAAATAGNNRGGAGVAPEASLMAVRVLSNRCTDPDDPSTCTAAGTAGDVAAGIRWAVDNGADIINLSLGGSSLQDILVGCAFCDAIEYAWNKGVIAVVAAGNDQLLPTGFGDEPAVVVTATNRADARASYSNTSSGLLRTARWPIAAPGGEGEAQDADCALGRQPQGILSTFWIEGETNSYACLSGTSMAAPHIAGALAILRSQGLEPQAAIDRLLGTARDLGPAGRDATFGVGLVDLARAAGSGPSVDTSTTTAPPPTTDAPSSSNPDATSNPTTPDATTDPSADSSVPEDTLPSAEQAAPFGGTAAAATTSSDEPPAWLIALAFALLASSALGAASIGWRRLADRAGP